MNPAILSYWNTIRCFYKPRMASQPLKDKALMLQIIKTKMSISSKTKVKLQKKPCQLCSKEKAITSICNNIERPNLAKEIQAVTGVKITQCDKKMFICESCLTMLNKCINFIQMCRKNNQDLLATMPATKVQINTEIQYDSKAIKKEPDDLDSFEIETLCEPFAEESDDIIDCEHCMKIFNNLNDYRVHLPCKKPPAPKEKVKLDPEKALCDICGKQLNSVAGIKEHLKCHEDAFPYKCAQCEYKGKTRSLLTVHIRSHLPESERPYKCAKCPKSVATASALQSHMRRTHSSERPHKCTLCEKAFKCKTDVNRHLRVTHYRQETVICNMCNTSFSQRNHLRRHLWRAHKLKSPRTLPNRLPSYIQHKMATGEVEPA